MASNLSEFGPQLWIAEGPVVSFHGFAYPTRMAAIRLGDGGLFVWSPIALTPALKVEVDALGPVRFVVSPNKLHHLFVGEWKSVYPQARLFAPPGLRRRSRLAFDGDLGDAPDPGWSADIDQVAVRGSFAMVEVVFFHRLSRTAILADLIQNFPPDWFKGWRAPVARWGGIVAPQSTTPSDWRSTFVNRRLARAAAARILAWPIERALIAHGDPAPADGAAFVRRGLAWLA